MLKTFASVARSSLLALFLLLIASNTFAQKTVRGQVTNRTTGQPVVGASVQVKGTNSGTLTNDQGSFVITTRENSTLVVLAVGFESSEQSVAGKSMVNFSLTETTNLLNEVVVTGYGTQRKKDITGSVAVVNVNNLKQVPGGTTEALLQGQASGVTVINSGQPGGGSNLRIRGITSIGNVNPLIIVDGTPGGLHDLNVNDIESIQILKDAGAAAIYGVRGSNGVVVVTTKKGRQGRVRVTYDGYYGTQRPLSNGFGIANTLETAQAVQQSYINSGLTPGNKQYGAGASPVIPDYITPTATLNGAPNTDPATYKLYTNQITKANKEGTDWFHEIFQPAPIQSHTVSASGGSDKSTYYMSLGYFDQEGTLLQTRLKRYSARINTVFNIFDRVRIGENAYIFNVDNPRITNQGEGNAIAMSYRENVIIPVYDIMGNYAGTGSQGLGNAQNPVANLQRTANNKGYDWQVQGNVFLEADLMAHLTARTSIGGNFDNFYYYGFNYTAYENAENNKNPNGMFEGSGYNSSRTWTNTLTYNNIFAQKHSVKLLVGSEAIRNYGRSSQSNRNNYFITNPNNLTVDPSLFTINFGDPNTQTNSGSPYENRLFSLFGRVDYNFADKYLLSGTIRRDGSSVFAKEARFGWFPSVSGAWRISREGFFPRTTWLDELKIRGGWGKLGSLSNINPTNPYSLYSQSAANSFYDINGSQRAQFGLYASQLGNVETSWEEDIITNVGIDATLLKNKLDFSIEWYKKAISGLLFAPALPATAGGASAPFVNSGNIENKGIDASLTYRGNLTRSLGFNATATFTSYKNSVVALPPGVQYYDRFSAGGTRLGPLSRFQVGQPMGEFFGYQVEGLFQDAADVAKSATQTDAAPGRLKFRDVNGDKKITPDDRTFFGDPNPKFTYGLNLGVNYKNFDLSAFFYGSVGNKVINYVRYWTDFPQVFAGAVSKEAATNSAHLVNSSGSPTPLFIPDPANPANKIINPNAHVANSGATIPVLEQSANFSNSGQFSSYYMEDGSFLKCKSLILGYTLPGNMLSRYKVERLRIYVQATNLFQITKYKGLDPELQGSNLNDQTNFGIDFGNYPNNQRMFVVGLNINF
ncbi:MAG: TonB-dependent receptor plug [Chitinophagaceae bacterium]|nr:TonB-dependent receptor plug [Chitinophagaceae bacterium]